MNELDPQAFEKVAQSFGGSIHGGDAEGIWDVEFPDGYKAAAYCDLYSESAWLRDSITTFNHTCVIQVDRAKWERLMLAWGDESH